MEYSLCSDKGIIATSSLSSSSSSSGSPSFSSSSSPSTNYPLSPPAAVTSSPPSSSAVSSSSSSPNSPPTDLPPEATSLPSSSRSVLPPVTVVVISSCAACKFLGQICTENCVLATCFPPDDLIKFTTVYRVFGASNIIKLLQVYLYHHRIFIVSCSLLDPFHQLISQELPESQRADAVSSMVYEANARLRDPVYGCVGPIFQLQKQVSDLQAHLAKAQAEIVNMQCEQVNLMALICMETGQSPQQSLYNFANNSLSFMDDNVSNVGGLWEPLWT